MLATVALLILAIDPEESRLLDLINGYRVQNNAPKIAISETLQNAARWQSYDMARVVTPSHTDSVGRSASTRITAFGYPLASTGENIYGGGSSADAVFAAFKASFDHNQSMLNTNWKEVGVGRAYAPGSTFGWYWTVDFANVFVSGPVVPPVVPPTDPSKPPVKSSSVDVYTDTFQDGMYTFKIIAPYGLRVSVDSDVILDRWREAPAYTYSIRKQMTAGSHKIKVEHFETKNFQTITVTWTKN